MRRLLWLVSMFVVINSYSQVSSTNLFRVNNPTTAFGINLPEGTQVYDVLNDKLYKTTAPVSSISTLTTASGSFRLLVDIDHNHDLGRYSLKAPANVDGLTAANFRTTLFGGTSNDYQLSIGYWATVPTIFSFYGNLNDYGSMIAWGGAATNGFIAIDNVLDEALIGGGDGNGLGWMEPIIHGGNFNEYGDTRYLQGNETITLSGDLSGSGTVSINATIASSAVEAAMLNNNIISGKTALTSGLISTDELMISDAGTVKRMDVSVLQSYMQSSLSFGSGNGTVTSVDLSVPTGFSVSGNPVTSSGTLALSFASGYSLPTTANQTNWTTAYNWGNHASAGYLTSESDPVFSVHAASGITSTNITNWNSAFGWGNHSLAGYTTITNASSGRIVTSNGGTALYGQGNLTFNGTNLELTGDFYVKHSPTEYGFWANNASSGAISLHVNEANYSDYMTGGGGVTAASMRIYGSTHSSNAGDIAFRTYYTDASAPAVAIDGPTGQLELYCLNHAASNQNVLVMDGNTVKYRTPAELLSGFSESDPVYSIAPASGITSTNITNWNSAFGWGNHASQGYITDGNTGWDNTYGFITGNQTITLTGDVTGSGTTSISTTVADDSHNHTNSELSTLTADHRADGQIVTMTNGNAASVNFGDVCYVATDGHMEFADADLASKMPGLYMAIETISASGSGKWLRTGIVRDNTWNWTIGDEIYISTSGTTGNTLTQTRPSGTGDQVQVVGLALTADKMDFNPNLVVIQVN